jgi:GT2 family glycosyltransferase
MAQSLEKNRYCCIIVTYNRSPNLTQVNRAIGYGLVDGLIISDNSNNAMIIEGIKNQYDSRFKDKYIIIENHENLGISRAMNIAFKRALELGFNFAFLLDDDAQLSDDYFEVMKETMEHYKGQDPKIAVVCPIVSNNPKYMSKSIKRRIVDNVKTCITSGMLIDITIASSLGYSEEYFLEHADTEFTTRLYNSGFRILRYNRVLIHQQLGMNLDSPVSRFLYLPAYCQNILYVNINISNSILYFMPLYEPNRILNIDKNLLKFIKQTTPSEIKLFTRLSVIFFQLIYRHIILFILTRNSEYLKLPW